MPFPFGLGSKTLTFGRYSSALGHNRGGNVKVGFDDAMLHVPTGEVIAAGEDTVMVDPTTGVASVVVPVTVTDDLVAKWDTTSPTKYQRLKITVTLPGYPPEARYVDIHPDDPAVMDYDQLHPYAVAGGLAVQRAQVISVAGLSGDITAEQLAAKLHVVSAAANRPAPNTVAVGTMIYDTTTRMPLWSDGTAWRDATGRPV